MIKKKRSCRAKLSSSSKRFSSQVARFTSLKLFACGEASLSRNYVSSSYERILDRAAPTFTFFRRVYARPSMLVSSNFLEQKSSFSPLISFRRVRVMEISRWPGLIRNSTRARVTHVTLHALNTQFSTGQFPTNGGTVETVPSFFPLKMLGRSNRATITRSMIVSDYSHGGVR